ncbi:AMP phosphorylase [Candidatus Bilamarchaeum dharawalense]|uniref:AMP phosphorylase n=1 Tax=Candidatus Bilamarchaeum dharawalense TaxID=2885759 RepID=A0A5E4LRM7_9ARCH|nr:AMP phosphorylase [Candidatus Bilamarchaeum dharawalense]
MSEMIFMVEYVESEMKKVDVWKLKKYVCKVKPMDIMTGKNIIVLNKAEAQEHDIYSGYRTELKHDGKSIITIVDVSEEIVEPGEVGIFRDLTTWHKMKKGDTVEIVHMDRPESITYIKKKLDKGALNAQEIRTIVKEIMQDKLSEIETSAWIAAAYINGFTDDEIIALAEATVDSGDQLNLGKHPILDKHCIGGVAGNRTTMIVVPIITALGLYMPKTSSRSITSAAGTADTMEVLADVTFNMEELRSMVLKAKGAIVWGGGMKLAPVDDKLIRVRHPLSLDPEGMLLASILGKKKSVGAEYAIIDIPVGRGVKVPYIERGNELAKHFISVGDRLGIKIEALITDGAEPVGNGIGPALECFDVLNVLQGKGPEDLKHKSVLLAGKLLELCGKVDKGQGYGIAEKTLMSGKALAKFREIVEIQGGNPNVSGYDIKIGDHTHIVTSEVSGSIFHIDNKTMAKIARIAGSPRDKGAGVLLHRVRGDRVEVGDKLYTIFAESEAKLDFTIKAIKDLEPIEMRKMLLGSLQ